MVQHQAGQRTVVLQTGVPLAVVVVDRPLQEQGTIAEAAVESGFLFAEFEFSGDAGTAGGRPLKHGRNELRVVVGEIPEAVVALHRAGQAITELVAQRTGAVGRDAVEVIAARGHLDVGLRLVQRLLGDNIDHAARFETAVKRRRRPLQHLDLLDIHQLVDRCENTAAKAILQIACRGEAAQAKAIVAAAPSDLARHPRHGTDRAAQRGDATVFDQFARDRLDGERRLLHQRVTLVGGWRDKRTVRSLTRADHRDCLEVLSRFFRCFGGRTGKGCKDQWQDGKAGQWPAFARGRQAR
ncbi:hypothetical protein D3C71_1341980 [compost metagenome]